MEGDLEGDLEEDLSGTWLGGWRVTPNGTSEVTSNRTWKGT